MPHFFSNKRLIILMVSIIILVALIGFSLRERETVTWPEQFARDSVGVVQSVFSRPAHYVAASLKTCKTYVMCMKKINC